MEGIHINHNAKEQRFETIINGEKAFIEYNMYEGFLAIMHTEVPESMGGHGIGSALAIHVLNYARENSIPVKVYCPFVIDFLKRHTEYQDVLAPSHKERM